MQLSALNDSMSNLAPRFQTNTPLSDSKKISWWDYAAADYPQLTQAARRLLSMHTTSCASERNSGVASTPRLGTD